MSLRPGLSFDKVVDAASDVLEREGPDKLSLAAVAKRLGVKTPSLYNHIGGIDALRSALRLRALHDLGGAMQRAAMGRSGHDALRAIATAYRGYARQHPGLYALTQRVDDANDRDIEAASRGVVEGVLAVLRGYALGGEEALHATRCLRSALHGFVTLETSGGFGLPLSADASFEHLVAVVDHGIRAAFGRAADEEQASSQA